MGKLQGYLFRQLLWATLTTVAVLTCVVWLTRSLRFVEIIVSQGLSLAAFLSFTLLLLPMLLAVVGPIALFIATLFVYNKMMHDREIVILSASGLGPGFIARPAVALAVLMTALGYLNTLYLTPAAFREFKDLQRAFRADISQLFVQEGVFSAVGDGITVFIRERSGRGSFRGIVVHDERDPENPVTLMAERGAIVSGDGGSQIVMVRGSRQELRGGDGELSLFHFDRYNLDLTAFRPDTTEHVRDPRERRLGELLLPASMAGDVPGYQRLRMEGLSRLGMPLLHVCYVLIALAVLLSGGFSRRGQLHRVMVAALLVAAVQLGFFGARSAGTAAPELEALVVAVPVAAIAVSAAALAAPGLAWRRRARAPGAPG